MFNNDFLIHYGVSGQKWGKRKYQNVDGTLTDEGREHYGVGQKQKAGSKIGQVGARIRKYVNQTAGNIKEKTKDKISEKRGPGSMSDEELDERLKRMRKESEYARLQREIDGGNQNGGGGKKGDKKHPYLAKAVALPVAAAIGVGVSALTKEKVSSFLDHRASTKLKAFESASKSDTSIASLSKLFESARRASDTAGHPIQGSVDIKAIVNNNLAKKAASVAVKDSKRVTDFVNRTSLSRPILRRGSRSFRFRGGYGS